MPPRASRRSSGSNGDRVRQTIVETLEAPRLKGIRTEDFVLFAQKREIYERQVQEKSQEQGVQISATTLRNSIEKPILNILITAQWVPVTTVEELTEEHLKACIKDRSQVKPEDYDLAQIERDISSIKMERTAGSLEMQVWNLGLQYATKLDNLGYSTFIDSQPKLAIGHILNRLTHDKLQKRMKLTFRLKKDQMKADYNNFLRETAKEARALDRHEAASAFQQENSDSDAGTARNPSTSPSHTTKKKRHLKRSHDGKRKDQVSKKQPEPANDGSGESATKKRRPSCLNPKCDKKHFIRECEMTSTEDRKKLLDQYYTNKKAKRKDGEIGQVLNSFEDKNSSLFSATFCDGAVEATALADQGSDECILPPNILDKIRKVKPDLNVTTLDHTRYYGTVDASATSLPCSRTISLNIMLRIRHGTNLSLRRMTWFVSDKPVAHCIISRHVLSALGLNNRVLLEAASHRYNGIVDVPDILEQDEPASVADTPSSSGTIHSLLCKNANDFGSSFHNRSDESDETVGDTDIYIDLGDNDRSELLSALKSRVEEARANGMSSQGCLHLSNLFNKYESIFRIRLGNSPPASVPPMRIRLKPDQTPIRVKARRYSAEQRAFMEQYADKLLEMDFAFIMPTASWQAAPLIVVKPGSRSKYRMAIDLRPVNAATVKESWPMPHLESEMLDFVGSTCFASLDFVSAYWQLPLHPDSYDLCGIVTPRVVLASKRVLPGLANATSYFQSTVEPLFAELRSSLKAWLDDFNLHSADETGLLKTLERFFAICTKHGLYLSAVKSVFFSRSIRWCGRLISGDGYQLDPSRLAGLSNMHEPSTAAELGEFIYCCRWMAIAIPDFTRRVGPLTEILERAYAVSGKRTKRSVRNIPLQKLSWGPTHSAAFVSLQETLQSAVKLSYLDPSKEVCIYTDASDRYWSAVVTQIEDKDLQLPLDKQRHEPLAFLGSEFKGAELGWTTFEKEAFAIFQTFEKLDYLLMSSKPAHVYTDHRNLLFVFAPLALEPALGRHIVSKVQRWALYLSRFPYVIEHVSGEANVFADILTRWTRGYKRPNRTLQSLCSIVNLNDQIVPPADNIEWPSMDIIRQSQASCNARPKGAIFNETNRLHEVKGCMWIPESDLELQLKIIVTCHCGVIGHRGTDATSSILKENFHWQTMDKDVRKFVQQCLHCMITRTGKLIPRPLAHAIHGQKPNEVIHMDFLYMGPSTEQKRYLLIIRDDHSSFVWLWPTESCTSAEAASALIHWIGSFGAVQWLISDQGSHFKNTLINELSKELRINHHFTTAYSPWANGTVERLCKEVLRSTTALCSEWKLAPKDWPAVTECVQSVLNHAPLKRLGLRSSDQAGVYRTPLEVFTGHTPVRPLMRAMPVEEYRQAHSTEEIELQRVIDIGALQNSLEVIHRNVAERSAASRKRQVTAHNRKTNIQPVNFHVGDFVLVRRATNKGHKLQFKWIGPRRIIRVNSDLVFEVEDLITQKRETVHARRLILYRSDLDGSTLHPELLKTVKHLEATYQDALRVCGIRLHDGIFDVHVEWDGLPDEIDYTWEPLDQVHEDIPDLLQQFLNSPGDRKTKQRAQSQCI